MLQCILHWKEAKKGLCGACDVHGNQLDVGKSLLLARRAQAPFVAEWAQNFKRICPICAISGWKHCTTDFPAGSATSCAQNVVGEPGIAATPSSIDRPVRCAALSETTGVTSHFSKISFSFFVCLWHKYISTANHSLAKERKCSVFTGTGNKCEKKPQ